jgi:hypothetical protein
MRFHPLYGVFSSAAEQCARGQHKFSETNKDGKIKHDKAEKVVIA